MKNIDEGSIGGSMLMETEEKVGSEPWPFLSSLVSRESRDSGFREMRDITYYGVV